jgi:hypothetical protein
MPVERRTLILVLSGLAAIALVSAVSWFFANFERRTETVELGAGPEARRNPLLALERLLARLEIQVESVPGRNLLWQPPAPGDSLVVRGLGPLGPERRARLRAWIEAGGRLVTEAVELGEDGAPPDDLLAELGVQLKAFRESGEGVLGRTTIDGLGGPLAMRFEPGWHLDRAEPEAAEGEGKAEAGRGSDSEPDSEPDSDSGSGSGSGSGWGSGSESKRDPESQTCSPSDQAAGGVEPQPAAAHWPGALSVDAQGRTRLVSLPVGEGRLTVLSDTEMLTNGRLGDQDHALVAAWLALPAPGGKVWLLYDSGVPWLGALLWSAAPLALTSAALLIGCWLWSLGARLGPLEPPPDRRRRDLLEHLDASAAFLWRHGRAARLVEPARRRVLADWERHRPELRRLDPLAQAEGIAAHLGLPVAGVTEALTGEAAEPRDFVYRTARLQGLWHGARPAHRRAPPGTAARRRSTQSDPPETAG